MDGPVECPSVSSRVRWPGRSGRPCLMSIPLLFFLGGGGGGCRCIPPGGRRVRPSSFFWGKVAFDAVGLGVGLPCFRVDSEEALLKRTDEQALLARAAPGATPGMKLVTKSWIVGRWENTNGMESMKYVPQRTASVWMPFEQA